MGDLTLSLFWFYLTIRELGSPILLFDSITHNNFTHTQSDEGLARLVEAVLNQILKGQVTEQLQALPYERSDDRQGQRNGYRPRNMKTRVGPLKLQIPRVRSGRFSTGMFGRYQRREQALVLAMMEMVLNGVSTRKVRRITGCLCGTEFSKSTVSELCKNLDPLVRD